MAHRTALTSILVPLDGSSFAEEALPLAAAIASRTGATLRLALVHQSPPGPLTPDATEAYANIEVALRSSQHEYLQRVAAGLQRQHGVKTSVVVLAGIPGPELERHLAEVGFSLVVMSTHGRGGLERAWLGSVADYLVRSASAPVLLVRPCGEGGHTAPRLAQANARIIVALDGSPQAESVLGVASELARVFKAELSLIEVVQPITFPFEGSMMGSVGYDEQLTQVWRREATDYLADIAEQLRQDDLRVSYAAVLGPAVAETLLDLARANMVGLIALSTHGRSGLPRLMLGSVADKVVRGAGQPVLVYRSPPQHDVPQPPGQ